MKTVTISIQVNVNDWANYIAINKDGGVYELEDKPIENEQGFGRKGGTRSGCLGKIVVNDWRSSVIDLGEQVKFMHEEEPKGHPNASILMEIAKEAAINPNPINQFLAIRTTDKLTRSACYEDFRLLLSNELEADWEIRRKPRTIRIGNYDVPEPSEVSIKHFDISTTVMIEFEKGEDAKPMLKALQELLGAKQ